MIKKIALWAFYFFEAVIIIYVIFISSLFFSKNSYGYSQFGKYTLSTVHDYDLENIQGVNKGDLIVIRFSDNIEIDDVIYYYFVSDEKYLIKSDGVLKVKNGNFTPTYVVGDVNTLVSYSKVVGKYIARYPLMGYLVQLTENIVGFFIFVILPILIIIIYQIIKLVGAIYEDEKNVESK